MNQSINQVEPGSNAISEVNQVNRGQAASGRTAHVELANNFMTVQFLKYCFLGKDRLMLLGSCHELLKRLSLINTSALNLTTNAQCGGAGTELDKRRESVARRAVAGKQVVTML